MSILGSQIILTNASQDPTTGEFAKARNSNLNEDLGKVEYVFSDKTGTLTSNEMQLREIAIKSLPLGSAEFKYATLFCLLDHTSTWFTMCIVTTGCMSLHQNDNA